MKPLKWITLTALIGSLISPVQADEPSVEEYRAMMDGESPGAFWVDDGKELFYAKSGPQNVSLEKCDFGKGPGVIKGVYAELPRYFEDVDQVMDLETRIMHCMITLQGKDKDTIVKNAFSNPKKGKDSEMEKIVAFIAAQSNGEKFNLTLSHPKEMESYKTGEVLFWRRAGSMDFSCATCHAADGKRIRLQTLYNAYNDKKTIASWPTYRVSKSTVRTMQNRMWDCHWQMRLPDVDYGSAETIDLITFMTKESNGGEIQVPSIKR
jgi:sulfur-oxidizing protein SoxA